MKRKSGGFIKYDTKKIIAGIALAAFISLADGRGGAKIITALIKDACKKNKQKEYQDEYYRTMLYRLQRDGLVVSPVRGIWAITSKGRNAARAMRMPRIPEHVSSGEESVSAVVVEIPV